MKAAPAGHYTPAKRTLSNVMEWLEKCKKEGSDITAARLLFNHGRLEDDAREFVIAYLK